tara:strand:- start:41060 stop:41554 length:495 start_codon:yes stop_codon:yes gene_type:complete
MSSIKKAFVEIVETLQANANELVGDILPQIVALASAKTGGGGGKATTFHKNEDGVIVAIRCYYHGLWMSPEVAEFGKKASSATGFNSMCKDGVSKWTKQERTAKAAKEQLLQDVMSEELASTDLADAMANVEAERELRVAREDAYGFDSLEACLEDNVARGIAA